VALAETGVLVLVLVLALAAEPGEHLHDPDDVPLRFGVVRQRGLHPAQVDERGAFGCRACGDEHEALAVFAVLAATGLRDVGGDTGGGSAELVGERAIPLGKLVGDVEGGTGKLQSNGVDVELFVVEHAGLSAERRRGCAAAACVIKGGHARSPDPPVLDAVPHVARIPCAAGASAEAHQGAG